MVVAGLPMAWILPLMKLFSAKFSLVLIRSDEELWEGTNGNASYLVEEEDLPIFASKLRDRVFILCKHTCFSSAVWQRIEVRNVVWLVPKEEIHMSTPLSLHLDSMLLSYEASVNFGYEIYEHYGFENQTHVESYLGNLSEHGFALEKPEYIWNRRSDLNGVTLKNCALHWRKLNDLSVEGKPRGIFPEVLQMLQRSLNFSVEYVEPRDGTWGAFNTSSQRWQGIIGETTYGNVHFASTGLTVSFERFEAVDFSFGLMEEILTLMLPKETAGKGVNFKAYIIVYQLEAWLGFFAICILSVPVISTSLAVTSERKKSFCVIFSHMPTSMAFLFRLLIQRDVNLPTVYLSAKVLLLSLVWINYMIYQLYITDLTAQITSQKSHNHITSFQYLLDNDYTLYLTKGKVYETILESSPKSSAMFRAYTKLGVFIEDETSCNDDTECWFRLIQTESSSALYLSSLAAQNPLQVLTNLEEAASYHLAIALPKNSDLTHLFNYHIIKMYEKSFLKRIVHKWLLDGRPEEWTNRIFPQESQPVGVLNLYFPLLILIGGLTGSVCLVAIEVLLAIEIN